jgi:gliding motility-associated-like protein
MTRIIFICTILLSFYGKAQKQELESWEFATKLHDPIIVEKDTTHALVIWKEVPEDRTLFSQSFIGEHGQTKQVFSSVPLHFTNSEGYLMPYDINFTQHADHITFEQQEYPITFFNSGCFQLSLGKSASIQIGHKTNLNGNKVEKKLIGHAGKITYYKFENQPISQQLVIGNGKVGFHYRIFEPLNLQNEDLLIDEFVAMPENWKFKKTDFQWLLSDSADENRAVLTNVLCYDANNNMLALEFEIMGQQLRIRVPNSWLQQPERAYPITIDPLIAGIPSIWTAGQMPSCFMPSYNEDSIQVTIPAGITPTGVYVDASFYANPFTFSTMAQGSMYFSSSCGSSQTFTVTGPTASLAGTAYLDSFNLMNPLACCLQKSCNPIQFWVSMHLGRNANAPGCNSNFILYDPLTTSWPFQVVVYGRSPESYGNEFYTSQTPICSNKCQLNATAYARYGVPPFTFTHPWTSTIGTVGQNLGCNSGASNFVFNLDIPNCPVYCDSSYTLLSIPPPTIVDACGTPITGIQPATKPLIAAIEPTLNFDSTICNGAPIQIQNQPCIADGITQFFNGSLQGFGDVNTTIPNNSDSLLTVNYFFFGERMGCISDTLMATVTIVPNPQASISFNPNPLVVGNNSVVESTSLSLVSAITQVLWQNSDSSWFQNSPFSVNYQTPGNFPYCVFVSDAFNCQDSTCQTLVVVPATIENINIVTPNGDGINDLLYFEYLGFYPNSSISILNRWGQVIYENANYLNDWDGSAFTEGTYFYKLQVPGLNKVLQDFFYLDK